MSNLWKAVSIVTLVAVLLTAAAVVWTSNPVASAQPVQANTQASEKGITIVAQGQVTAKPDIAWITIGVRTTAVTARQAMDENNAAVAAVIAKLESMGIAKKDMQTGNISLYPQTKAPRPEEAGPEQIVAYWANNSLRVTVRNLGTLGAVLDAAVSAGANSVSGIRFGVDDDSKLRDEALKEAIKTARAKADLVAEGLGLRVTGVQSVSLESYATPGPVYYEVAAPAARMAAGEVPVETGELTFTASVRVTFVF